MCGLLGIIGEVTEDITHNGVHKLIHRGPDSQGSYIDKNLFLGHTRLAIQDLSIAGNQPMTSEDGRYTIIFNGEIYNHLELRRALTPNENYRGHSDTETLLKSWALHGTSILPKLNGIFAFAIFDKVKNKLTLARDRFGVKPLYYYASKNTFAFASEIKALKDLPGLDQSIDYTALSDYLTFLYSTGDKTPFAKIKKLLPGHYIELDGNTLKISNTSNFQISSNKIFKSKSEGEWMDLLEEQLTNAIDRQLLSDVPVGYLLSGGLDSSSILALARKRLGNNTSLDAFTLDSGELLKREGFQEDIKYAIKVAEKFNTNLHIAKASDNLLHDIENIVWYLDEPIGDTAALNLNTVCRNAKDHGYKVLMSGIGADELFGGYRRHMALSIEPALKLLPGFIKSGLGKFGDLLPINPPSFRRSKKLINTFSLEKTERLISHYDWLGYNSVHKLFNQDISENLANYHPHDFFRKNQINDGDLEQMLYWEKISYLPDNCLLYTDRISMRYGIEIRVPFLDNDLEEFSNQIPGDLKIKNSTSKYILKKLMSSHLPKEIVYRKKTGFGAPIRHRLKSDLQPLIEDYLSESSIKRRGIFDYKEIDTLIENNNSGKIDASASIWTLLVIESWMRSFTDK